MWGWGEVARQPAKDSRALHASTWMRAQGITKVGRQQPFAHSVADGQAASSMMPPLHEVMPAGHDGGGGGAPDPPVPT